MEKGTNAIFSIIIPVYNVEPYLRECLNSIINQTFQEFEIICIDDGSTDNSFSVLQEYAQKDKRFKIFRQENQGSGIARNYGINTAKGKYLVFVDPDDWVVQDYLEQLYDAFKESGADVLQFDYMKYNDISKKGKPRTYGYELKKSGGKKNIFKDPYYDRSDLKLYIRGMVWDKAYTLNFIRSKHLKLAPTRIGQDNLFSIGAVLTADKIFYLNKYLYYYRTRPGSAVNKVTKKAFCVFDNIQYVHDFLKEKNLFDECYEDFAEYKIQHLRLFYNLIPEELKNDYIEQTKGILSDSEYKRLYHQIKTKNRSFLQQVFSIGNKYDNAVKSKIVTILGIDFEICKK